MKLKHFQLTVSVSEELLRQLIATHGEDLGELTGADAVAAEATTIGLVCEEVEALDGPLVPFSAGKAG